MGFDFSKLNPFGKKTLEGKAASSKVQLVISRSASDADKYAPYCVREYTQGKNHSFKTKGEAVAYIFQTYQDHFEIKDFERLQPTEIEDYNALISARKQQIAKK